ncbi:Protein dispatched homolog 3 (Patched domain-containing protein 2) [Durusdinium trenchii]|uniref:Protein dispatched homolog 3 (Patched domain-containing protein 2) n=1 Tax=Durusdinium trenchii TaxID=1381693 RepID=A0ABP0I3P0_9DINO
MRRTESVDQGGATCGGALRATGSEREQDSVACTMGFSSKYGEYVAKQPLRMYCSCCGVFVGMFALCVALAVALGTEFFNYNMEAPLYLRSNYFNTMDDAMLLARSEASPLIETPQVQLERVDRLQPSTGAEMNLKILFIVKDGSSVYRTDMLQRLMDLEDTIRQSETYRKVCQLDWNETDKARMYAGDWDFVAERNKEELPPCVAPESQLQACTPSGPTTCAGADARPLGLLDCAKGTGEACSRDELVLSQSFVDSKLSQIWAMDPFTDPDAREFYVSAGSGFGSDATSPSDMVAVSTTFFLGLPLAGFNNTESDSAGQESKLEELVVEEFLETLLDIQKELNGSGNVEVWFNGFGLMFGYMSRQIPMDVSWAFFSFIFVFAFMTWMKRSFWLSSMGMGMIFLSFPFAYLLYWGLLGQRYFGIFNLLCIFIIMGIGADDIFVFTDTFDHSADPAHGLGNDRGKRLTWTLKRAGGAMLVTSLTTTTSFVANARSSFPGISTFGLFAAALVIANYVMVVLYYPTVVSLMAAYFPKSFCCGGCCGRPRGEATIAPAPPQDSGGDKGIDHAPSSNPVTRYFDNTHGKFVNAHKLKILAACAAFIAFFGINALNLEVDSEVPQFFPRGSNFGEYQHILQEYFVGGVGDTGFNVKVGMALGFQEVPVDRTGTNEALPDDLGVPAFAPDFSLQRVAPCVLAVCERFGQENRELALQGGDQNEITCWAKDLYDMMYAGQYGANASEMWARALMANETQLWDANLVSFLANPAAAKHRGNILFKKDAADSDLLASLVSNVEVSTSFLRNVEYGQGIEFVELWKVTMQDWYSSLEACEPVAQDFPVHTTVPQSGHRFYVARELRNEAFSGVFLSLILAYVILTVFSGNFVVAFFAFVCISCIVLCVIGFIVISGSKLGMLESINLVMTPGLSVDIVAHLCEAYITASKATDRASRMQASLHHVGVSVVSGAFSTCGACIFLFFPEIVFFVQFGTFIFVTIALSLFAGIFFFTALMFLVGPQGTTGDIFKRSNH